MVIYGKLALGAILVLGRAWAGVAAKNGTTKEEAKQAVRGGGGGGGAAELAEIKEVQRKLSSALDELKSQLGLGGDSSGGEEEEGGISPDGGNPGNLLGVLGFEGALVDILTHYDEALCRAAGLADVAVNGMTEYWSDGTDGPEDHRHEHDHDHNIDHYHNFEHNHDIDHIHKHDHKHDIGHKHTGFNFAGCTLTNCNCDIKCGTETDGSMVASGMTSGPDMDSKSGTPIDMSGNPALATTPPKTNDANMDPKTTTPPLCDVGRRELSWGGGDSCTDDDTSQAMDQQDRDTMTETDGFASGDDKFTTRTDIKHKHGVMNGGFGAKIRAVGTAIGKALQSDTCNSGDAFPNPPSTEWANTYNCKNDEGDDICEYDSECCVGFFCDKVTNFPGDATVGRCELLTPDTSCSGDMCSPGTCACPDHSCVGYSPADDPMPGDPEVPGTCTPNYIYPCDGVDCTSNADCCGLPGYMCIGYSPMTATAPEMPGKCLGPNASPLP